jgi:hypothetical protein
MTSRGPLRGTHRFEVHPPAEKRAQELGFAHGRDRPTLTTLGNLLLMSALTESETICTGVRYR